MDDKQIHEKLLLKLIKNFIIYYIYEKNMEYEIQIDFF